MAERLTQEPGVRILNDIVLNQVLVRFDGRGAATGGRHDEAGHRARAGRWHVLGRWRELVQSSR